MDTSSASFQILVALGSALFGAILEWLFTRGSESNQTTADFTGATIDNSDVNVGGTHLTVNNDNRVNISFSDVSNIVHHDAVQEEERNRRRRREEEAHERRLARIRRDEAEDPGTDWSTVILIGVVSLVALAFLLTAYLKYRDVILTAAALVATSALFFVLGALISMMLHRVRLDWRLTLQIVFNLALGTSALISLRWLSSAPPYLEDPEAFQALLDTAPTVSVPDLMSPEQQPILIVVTYQILGLVLLLTGVVLIILHSVKVLSVVGLVVKVRVALDTAQDASGSG